MHNLDSHQRHCLENAIYFTAIRGRNPATRTRIEFPSLEEAQKYGSSIGDGSTMIYAVTQHGHSDHLMNV